METRDNVKFCLSKGSSTTGVWQYTCNKSGKYRRRGKGLRTNTGSCKLDTRCTAEMDVSSVDGTTVKVRICKTHYGHDLFVGALGMSKDDGVSKEEVSAGVVMIVTLTNCEHECIATFGSSAGDGGASSTADGNVMWMVPV